MTSQLGRLAKSALIYGTGDVLTKIIGFLLLPLYTSYLTPDDYGVAGTLGVLSSVLLPIFTLGIGTAIGAIYFTGDPNIQRPRTLWASVGILVGSASIMAIAGVALSDELSQAMFRTPQYSHLVDLLVAALGFSIVATPFSLYYQFEQKPTTYTVISVTSTLLNIGLTILMIAVLRRGVVGWFEANLLGQGAMLLLYAIPAIRRVPFRWKTNTTFALLRLGIPLVPSFAFLFLLQQSNRFFLERLAGLEAAGLYAVGYNLGMAINLIVLSFTRAWPPYFLSFVEKQEEAKPLFGRITTYYLIGGGCITLCFFIFARPLLMVMTTPAFHAAYNVVGLVATAQFLTGLFSVLLVGIYFAQDVRNLPLIQAGAALVAVVVCLAAIPLFGAMGAALAYMLGTLVMCALTHVWNVRHRAYFHPDYEPERITRFSVFFVVVAVIFLLPREFSLAAEIVLTIAGAAVLLIFALSLLAPDERAKIRQFSRQAARIVRPRPIA